MSNDDPDKGETAQQTNAVAKFGFRIRIGVGIGIAIGIGIWIGIGIGSEAMWKSIPMFSKPIPTPTPIPINGAKGA
ncbi:hypothetical protein [Desulfonatronum parangueonense]